MSKPRITAGAGINFVSAEMGSMLAIDPVLARAFRAVSPPEQLDPIQYNIDFNVSVETIEDEDILVVSEGNIQNLVAPAINVFRRTLGKSFRYFELGTEGVLYLEMPLTPVSSFSSSSKEGLLTAPSSSQYINNLRIESYWVLPSLDSAQFKVAPVFPLPEDDKLCMRVAEYSVTEEGAISFRLLRFGMITISHAIFQPGYGVSTSFRAA